MPYPTSRKSDVNFGDRMTLRGGERKSLANISVAEGQAFTLYATAEVVAPAAAPPVFPVVGIEWGHGGASLRAREFRIYRRLRVPVVGSTVSVAGWMVDDQGQPPPKTVLCRMSAFIAPGSDGETLRNTDWISQSGPEGLISSGPEQILTVEGYPAAASAARWLMLFDAVARPANGAFPDLACPARRAFRRDRFDSQGFRFGVFWAVSSTPITLTFNKNDDLRVDVEVLT
ncbi:MAG TPA: hypothetical protein VIJ22_05595 [Polyangiaceae bacterium]